MLILALEDARSRRFGHGFGSLAASERTGDRLQADHRQYDTRFRPGQGRNCAWQRLVHGCQGSSRWSSSSKWARARNSGSTS